MNCEVMILQLGQKRKEKDGYLLLQGDRPTDTLAADVLRRPCEDHSMVRKRGRKREKAHEVKDVE